MKKMIGISLAILSAMTACSQTDMPIFRNVNKGWEDPAMAAWNVGRKGEEPSILPETFYAAGRLFEEQGLLAKAALQYRRAVAVNHNFAAAYDRLGVVLGRLGNHQEATACLERAVALRPNWPNLRNNLGFEYALQERWADAERELQAAVELQPKFDRARVNLGMVLAKLGRFEESLTQFSASLPEADSYYNLGLLLRGQQRYGEAAEAFRRVLALNPRFTAAQAQLDQMAPSSGTANFNEPSDSTESSESTTAVVEAPAMPASAVDPTTPAVSTEVVTFSEVTSADASESHATFAADTFTAPADSPTAETGTVSALPGDTVIVETINLDPPAASPNTFDAIRDILGLSVTSPTDKETSDDGDSQTNPQDPCEVDAAGSAEPDAEDGADVADDDEDQESPAEEPVELSYAYFGPERWVLVEAPAMRPCRWNSEAWLTMPRPY